MQQDEMGSLLDETAAAKVVRRSLLVETASLSNEITHLSYQDKLLTAQLFSECGMKLILY
jgi:hypothetical protein